VGARGRRRSPMCSKLQMAQPSRRMLRRSASSAPSSWSSGHCLLAATCVRARARASRRSERLPSSRRSSLGRAHTRQPQTRRTRKRNPGAHHENRERDRQLDPKRCERRGACAGHRGSRSPHRFHYITIGLATTQSSLPQRSKSRCSYSDVPMAEDGLRRHRGRSRGVPRRSTCGMPQDLVQRTTRQMRPPAAALAQAREDRCDRGSRACIGLGIPVRGRSEIACLRLCGRPLRTEDDAAPLSGLVLAGAGSSRRPRPMLSEDELSWPTHIPDRERRGAGADRGAAEHRRPATPPRTAQAPSHRYQSSPHAARSHDGIPEGTTASRATRQ
jgi:hypothetical protein